MSKKKFKDTTVGKMLLGAAGLINPTLGSVLQGVTSVTKSLDLLKILFGNKIVINVKNKSNEKKKLDKTF